VRFETDKLDIQVLRQGYARIQLPIKEIFPTAPVPDDMEDKDEIIPRRLLEIDLSSGPIRIIDNDTLASLTYGGDSYTGAPLKIGDYKRDDNTEVAKISVEISNAGQAISSAVGNNGDVVTGADCTLTLVWLNTTDFTLLETPAPRVLFLGKANNLRFNIETASMDIESYLGGYEASIPIRRYMPSCQWRKFKDARCGYTGSATQCDRTLTTCKRYGNVENFGGFPSLPKEQVIKA
jgi:phage-related protein